MTDHVSNFERTELQSPFNEIAKRNNAEITYLIGTWYTKWNLLVKGYLSIYFLYIIFVSVIWIFYMDTKFRVFILFAGL